MTSLFYTTVVTFYFSVKKVSTDTVVLIMSALFYATVLALYLSKKKVSTDTVA